MLMFAIWPLGTVRIVRSSVRMRVERRPIESTVPDASPTLRKSPTHTARSKISESPPITFSSVFCAASATAMPPIPRPASAAVGSPPNRRITTRTATSSTSASANHRDTRTSDAMSDASRPLQPVAEIALDRRVHVQQQPGARANREQHRNRRPELALEERQVARRDQPADDQRNHDEPDRAGEALRTDADRHQTAKPQPPGGRNAQASEGPQSGIDERDDQDEGEPMKQADAADPGRKGRPAGADRAR